MAETGTVAQPQLAQEQQKLAQIQTQYMPQAGLAPNIVYEQAYREQAAKVQQLQQEAQKQQAQEQVANLEQEFVKADIQQYLAGRHAATTNVAQQWSQYKDQIKAAREELAKQYPGLKISSNKELVEAINREFERGNIREQARSEDIQKYLESPTAVYASPEAFSKSYQEQFGRAPSQQELARVITPKDVQQLAAKEAYLKSGAVFADKEFLASELSKVSRLDTSFQAPSTFAVLPPEMIVPGAIQEKLLAGEKLTQQEYASLPSIIQTQLKPTPTRFDLEAMKTAAWRKEVGDPFAIPTQFEKSLEKLTPKEEPMFKSEPEGGFFTGMTRAVRTAMGGIEERLTLPKTGTPIDIPIGAGEMGIKGVATLPLTPFVVTAIAKKGLEEPEKIPEAIKGGAELAAAGVAEKPIETGILLGLGLYGARAGMPRVRFEEASRSRMVSQLFEPTTRSESLTATKELFGDVKTAVSREVAKPTMREEALTSTERLFGEYGRTLEREVAKPTLREESIVSVGKLAKEELARPTIREKAISGLKEAVAEEVKIPTERQIALAETRRLFGDVGKILGKEIFESRPTTRAESLKAVKEITKKEISAPTMRRESLEAFGGEIRGAGRRTKYILERPSGGYPKMEYFKEPTKEYIEAKYKELSPLESGRKLPEEPRPPIITERPSLIAKRIITEPKAMREIFRDVAGGTYEQTKIISKKYGEEMIPRELYAPGFKFEELGAKVPIKEEPKLPRQITPTTELKITEIPKDVPKTIPEKIEVIDLTKLEPKVEAPKIIDTTQLSALERQRQSIIKRIDKDPWAKSDLAKVEKKIEDLKSGVQAEPKFVKKDIMTELRERWTKEEERLAKAPSQVTKQGQILVMEKPEVIVQKPEVVRVVKPKVEAKVVQIPREEQIVKAVPKEKTREFPLLFERPETILGERYREIYKPAEEYKIKTVPIYKPVQVYKPAEITKQEPSAFQVPKEIPTQIPKLVPTQIPEQVPVSVPKFVPVQYPRPYLDVFWHEPPASEVPLDVPYMTKEGEKRVVRRKKPVKYTGKKRISPIFEGAEKLFAESPIKTKPTKVGKEIDVLGLGNIENIEDPLKTKKSSKTNKVISKEKQFWEV